ncbi:DUF4037 domain-containing protein [Paenibacillus sp. FSL H7-0350]|uniref:DUF4037 domain-containing protein n=1 Tax=Paenibacillus sp. FSL H7-0350 TaxID=2975345 RepID=UPI00315800E1
MEQIKNYSQNEFVEIVKKHFETVILPKLQLISDQVVNSMMIFIEGSVAYGFCDEKSDIDLDYYIDMDIDEDIRQSIRELFTGETYWHQGVRVSYGFGGAYWKFDLLMNDEMDRFWNEFDPYALNNIMRAIPVWDPKGILALSQKKVECYPDEIKEKIIRGLWVTVNDSGEYNFCEALKRNNIIEGRIYQYRAIEAMLRLVYILNNQYFYPTKWLSAGLDHVQEDFGLKEAFDQIAVSHCEEDDYKEFMKVHENMKRFMIKHDSIELECIDNYSMIFQKPFHIFSTF